jgi:phosphonate transport system permease protein
MTAGAIEDRRYRSEILAVVQQGRSRERRSLLHIAIGVAAVVVSLIYCDAANVQHYAGALGRFGAIAAEAFPPDFTRWRSWAVPLAETLAMSIVSTAISAVVALVLAIFVARNLSPIAAISALLRCAFNLFRSLPELVLGLVLVATVGFGPLAGIVALSLHSIGMLGKFFAELIEHADLAPIEALRAQGASRGQSFCFGVLPQILPRVVDLTLYRWEHNLRASAVMGLVGAGGIGFELISALRLFEYREGLALLILTFFLVTVIDFAGGMLRTRFVED